MSRIHLQAHRGACQEFMENSIPAFERAVELGADSLELDVQLTAEQEPVVFHDFAVDIAGSKRFLKNLSLTELQSQEIFLPRRLKKSRGPLPGETRVATLSEVLRLEKIRNAHLTIDIEIKREALIPAQSFPVKVLVERVLAVVDGANYRSKIVIRSFDREVLLRLLNVAPEIPRGLIWERGYWNLTEVEGLRAQILAPHFSDLSAERVLEAKSLGVKVMPYTVNERDDWGRLVSFGVDGITTDDLAGAVEFFS